MRQIMHYDGEFRRVEATSAVGSSASTDGGSDRVEYGTIWTILTPPPCWTGPGGSLGAQEDPLKNTEDPKMGA